MHYIKSISFATDLCFIVFFVIPLNGILDTIDTTFYLSSGFLWFFLAYIENEHVFSKVFFSKQCIFLILFILFFCAYSFFHNTLPTVIAGSFATFLRYCPFIMACFYININDNKRIFFLTRFAVIVLMLFALSAYVFFSSNPGIARALAANTTLQLRGIGGHSYAIGIAINSLALFYLNILLQKNRNYFFLFGILLFAFLLSLSIDSATTVFTFVFCIMISLFNAFFLRDLKGTITTIVFKVVMIYSFLAIILWFSKFAISDFLIYLSDKIDFAGHFVTYRLQQVGYGIVGYSMGGSAEARAYLREVSLNTFLEHPFIGIGAFSSNGVGHHCEILDLLAQYGIIGCSLLFSFIVGFIKNLYLKRNFICYMPILFYIVINCFLNPLHYIQTLFVVFCIIPLLIKREEY